ncbi:hypothetical protein, partial [Bradyrhizobium sp.]|uniref:hypothetical protein n=1 Tax=Bradyrhizobium sp. TaxID=376 RepID=UPI001EBECD84
MRAASLIALALLGSCLPAARAQACVFGVVEEGLGPPRTAEELGAEAKQQKVQGLRMATREAEQAWRAGADAPAALAEMLVPDIRAVTAAAGPCGAGGLIWTPEKTVFEEWLASTRYAGRASEFQRQLRDYAGGPLAPDCDAEVRQLFAEHLRRRLTPGELRAAYVFLTVRRPGYGRSDRIGAFAPHSVRPPLYWSGGDWEETMQIRGWLRTNPDGRALRRATHAFWAETAPLLADDSRLCPAAVARRRAEQAELVRRIDAEVAARAAQ